MELLGYCKRLGLRSGWLDLHSRYCVLFVVTICSDVILPNVDSISK